MRVAGYPTTDPPRSGGGGPAERESRMPPVATALAAVLAAIVAAMAVPRVVGGSFAHLVAFGAVCAVVGLAVLRSPVVASILLLAATFLRVALPPIFPVDLFLVAFAGMVASFAIWMQTHPDRLRGIGALEWAMALYLLWNLFSMVAPHEYPAIAPLTGATYSVPRFILTGTLIPFAMYVVGRYTFERRSAVRALFWTILSFGAYSALVSVLQFRGPTSLVWPRYIVEAPNWPNRAVGVFNQPVVNGFVLALGFTVAMLLMGSRSEPRWRRLIALIVAVGCGYGIYLTHTRAAWLGGAVVLVIGIVFAKGFRTGFVVSAGLALSMVTINWSLFSSTDRAAGGVGSAEEVEDRFNAAQTALWAFGQKPLAGWGIGRFQAVNTYHHQQWAPEVPWVRGYGIVAHQNELGILGELGLIGLALWIAVLLLVLYRLFDAYRTLPAKGLCGKRLALVAIMALVLLITTGFTVDLRFFDFPGAVVFLVVGVAVGWADRHKRAHVTVPGVVRPVPASSEGET
ncbi:O-antigen ligase family protein [Rhodococcus sp. NPDC059234]|uniref:O-antigen ligase family protein n=1 Tax=Rhodococcus sp. NPDC059234 TaxID=3346781 RepID=UPI00366C1328